MIRRLDAWVWTALAVLVLLALLPSVGRALAQTPGTVVEICTAQGMRVIVLDAPAEPAAADCPVCASGLTGWLQPPSPA